MANVSAFRLGMGICVRCEEPGSGLRHQIKVSAARSRYGCTADSGVLFW